MVRVIHPPGQEISEHTHDWPFLMLPTCGEYVETFDGGGTRIAGPSAVLHPPGHCHANCIGDYGMEAISIVFDASWIGGEAVALTDERPRLWIGGIVGAAARKLSRTWRDRRQSESEVAHSTASFLALALRYEGHPARRPRWLDDVLDLLQCDVLPTTAEIAARLNLHPAWLARAYRRATGEGLHETVRRRRVERAVVRLRATTAPLSEIALDAGFCDQSHMDRVFKSMLARTPGEVRAEQAALRALAAIPSHEGPRSGS